MNQKTRQKRSTDTALIRQLKRALPVAQLAAHEAGEFLAKKFGKFKQLEKKSDFSLVTEADRGAERIVLKILKKRFPQDEIIAEESGTSQSNKNSPFRWHIDPLDGTTNFVHGLPIFCVSIGLEFEQDQAVLGVIHSPILKDTFTAYHQGGAFLNNKKMRVSKNKILKDSLVSTGFSSSTTGFFEDEHQRFGNVVRKCQAVRRIGSAALDLAYVAAGRIDGFWEQGLKSWDVTAGLALVNEAGGQYSNMDGKHYALGSRFLLVSNGLIHSTMQDLLMPSAKK